MAAVRPIPLGQRNLLELRTPHAEYSSDADSGASSDAASDSGSSERDSSDSDADVSSEASSSDASSSESSSSFASSDQEDDFESDSASDQEEDHTSSSNEGGRPAELVYTRSGSQRHFVSPDSRNTLTEDVLETLGDMARTDNVGYIAWLIPFTGICTMLGTEFLACVNHFSCSENFPTLSYAATFKPEGFAFSGGMCLTAIFIFVSVVLFFWYLRLRMRPLKQTSEDSEVTAERGSTTKNLLVGYACLVSGVLAAISLFGLAVLDMRSHHDAHINFTIAFFAAAWATMIAVQIARKNILHEDETAASAGKIGAGFWDTLRRRSFWSSLRRWRRLDFITAYTLGRLLLNVGLASTFLFALFFLCANGVWPNPLGFTAVQEAFFEAVAIVCQLLFMGTLSCELARLARLVEHRDYMELERSE